MTVRGRPPPGDDPTAEWGARGDTEVDIDEDDLKELDADATTPIRPAERLPGYALGRRDERMAFFRDWGDLIAQTDRQGAARVLHAVRDQCIADGATSAEANAIVASLAKRAGVKLV